MNMNLTDAFKFTLKENTNWSIKISGQSMEPLLRNGDEVQIKPAESINTGECYLFRYKGQLLIHRLLKKAADKCYFIGDNSCRLQITSKDEVIGVLDNNGMRDSGIVLLNLAFSYLPFIPGFRKMNIIWRIRRKLINLLWRPA